MSVKWQHGVAGGIFLALFVSPIAAYIRQFGIGVWEDHGKWAEMGSAFSGIYSPLIAFLAFIILVGQVRAQSAINKHHFDRSYIEECREEINFYLERLDHYLDQPMKQGETPRSILDKFALIEKDELRSEESRRIVQMFILESRNIFDIWVSLYPILMGLGENKEYPYEHNFSGSILKIITILSMQTCVGLDKVYYSSNVIIKQGELKFWSK